MILTLSTTPKSSTYVGRLIVSSVQTGATSTNNYYDKNPPTVYKLVVNSVGSNKAKFTATTSHPGKVYFVILKSGTPTDQINASQIYLQSLDYSITYGKANASLDVSGVNILATLEASKLKSSTNYIIGAYLNSTVGNSRIYFLEFKTSKSSNGAAIKLAFNNLINSVQFIEYLSWLLRIQLKRLSLITT